MLKHVRGRAKLALLGNSIFCVLPSLFGGGEVIERERERERERDKNWKTPSFLLF